MLWFYIFGAALSTSGSGYLFNLLPKANVLGAKVEF